ncbi:MAG: hypothetical protein WC762_03140 [Methylobacter sp.]|jgi:hypothetical protein
MTIQSTPRKAGPAQGNGVNSAFPFTFKVFAVSEIVVTYLNAAGVESTLALTTDYTVELNADQNTSPGGTVTMLSAPATGTYITLTSNVPYSQGLQITNAGFYPESINNALDRVVIQIQQLAEQVSRSVKTTVSSLITPDQLLSSIATSVNNALNYATAAGNSATSAAGAAVTAITKADEAAASAASVNFPVPVVAGNMVRGKADLSGYESRTPTQVLSDIKASPIVRNHIDGLKLSQSGGNAIMSISPGQTTDSTNIVTYSLASILNKTTNAWVVGSGNGGLDEGAITNNNWYRWYLIQRPDTGVVDAVCSLSNGNSGNVTISIASPAVVTWANHGHVAGAGIVFSTTDALPTGLVAGTRYYVISTGLADGSFQLSATIGGAAINTSGSQSGTHSVTTPPALPANYTYYREIGSGLTDGAGQWTKIIQDGDFFQHDVIPTMGTTTNQGTSALVEGAIVPKGKRIKALLNIMLINGATPTGILVSDLSISDGAVATDASPLPQIICGVANQPASGQIEVMVNTNANFRTRLTFSDASTVVRLCTAGWYDYRGKN